MKAVRGGIFLFFLISGLAASEASAVNAPPEIAAGADMAIPLGENAIPLAGSAQDDGLPQPPGELSVWWSQVSGPAPAATANQAAFEG